MIRNVQVFDGDEVKPVGWVGKSFHPRPPQPLDFAAVLTSVGLLHGMGVPILAGTDAPNPGTAHGAKHPS
ncbi:MAG TPA: hypothetical protein VJT73_12605 [Polyangiaceae bacterium]|nr:hypothetical protein [Polyangiaceae bacterium]